MVNWDWWDQSLMIAMGEAFQEHGGVKGLANDLAPFCKSVKGPFPAEIQFEAAIMPGTDYDPDDTESEPPDCTWRYRYMLGSGEMPRCGALVRYFGCGFVTENMTTTEVMRLAVNLWDQAATIGSTPFWTLPTHEGQTHRI